MPEQPKEEVVTIKLPPPAQRVRIILEVDLPAGVDAKKYAATGADYWNAATGFVLRHRVVNIHVTEMPKQEVTES
jgi:hypothetical protein